MMNRIPAFIVLISTAITCSAQTQLTPQQTLGELLFQDPNLSLNRNQACSSCHGLASSASSGILKRAPGFIDPENAQLGTSVSKGSDTQKNGSLNAPSVGYAAYSPDFHWDDTEGLYVGGQFWNGRSKNLANQASKPFFNPVEMALPNAWTLMSRVKENPVYHDLFEQVYQYDLDSIPKVKRLLVDKSERDNVAVAFKYLVKAIAAFETSSVFNKFNSKYDYYLAGMTTLTAQEEKGLQLFKGKANCVACHLTETSLDSEGHIQPPLLTDFTYDNIGLPRNINIPGNPKPDLGLGGREDIKAVDSHGDEIGKHKVMSLRNIALTPPYGHNGVLATLEQVIHFYNTRDTLGIVANINSTGFAVSGWPKPEVSKNVNHDELGNLGLTDSEEKAIVAFMKTLTDDYPTWGKDPLIPPGTPSPFENQ